MRKITHLHNLIVRVTLPYCGQRAFGSVIAGLVHEAFEKKLPNRKGCPQDGAEWTVLSGIVMEDLGKAEGEGRLKVVALGTGTNCLGKSETSAEGLLVHDRYGQSHVFFLF